MRSLPASAHQSSPSVCQPGGRCFLGLPKLSLAMHEKLFQIMPLSGVSQWDDGIVTISNRLGLGLPQTPFGAAQSTTKPQVLSVGE
jgi:hypothetical protein